MIIIEKFTTNNIDYIRYKSNSNLLISRDGTDDLFIDVVDIESCGYTYTETDIPVPEPINNIPDSEALAIIIGGDA